MLVFLATSLAHVRSGPFQLHVDTNDEGVIGDTLIAYGNVEGFSALVVGDTEYEIRKGLRHRIRKGTPHAVIGDGKREVFAIDEVTGLGVGEERACPDTFSCCPEYEIKITGSVEVRGWGETQEYLITGIDGAVPYTSAVENETWTVSSGRRRVIFRKGWTGTKVCSANTNQCLCPEDFPFTNDCENISMSCYKKETGSELSTASIIAVAASAVLLFTAIVISYKKCKRNGAFNFEGNLL